MDDKANTIDVTIERVAESGDGCECGRCSLPCVGASRVYYVTIAKSRERFGVLCLSCAKYIDANLE